MKPLSSVLRWLLALVVLSTATIAEAGVSPFWQSLGGSATGNGVSQIAAPKAVFEVSTAVGSDGRPVVTYVAYPDEAASQGSIVVKRWTGTAWQTLSGATGIGQGYAPQIRISSTGVMNVAWLKDDASGNTEIHLRTATSTTWTPLGTSDSAGGIVGSDAPITAPFSLALDLTGKPLVAFLGFAQTGIVDVTDTPALRDGTLQVYVKQWTGSAWDFVGSDLTGGGASNAVSFAVDPTSFVHYADTPSLAVDSTGVPVVAFIYNTLIDDSPASNSDVYAVRWTGAAWVALGAAVPAGDSPAGRGGPGGISNSVGGSFNPSLAADFTDTSGRLALAWEEEPPAADVYVWVRVWNGVDAWDELAGSASGSGFTQAGTTNVLPQIAVDTSGPGSRPIVTWEGWTGSQAAPQIFVLRWNGADAWEEIFDSATGDGISAAALEAFSPSLALTPSTGVPTVAWLDARDPSSAQVLLRQFFSGPTFPLTVNVSGDGSVASNPIGVECASGQCVTLFPSGTSVTLLPQGGAGGVFGSWSGGCTGTGACTVAMTAARSVNASFVTAHTLAVVVPSAGGRVTSSPAGIAACTDSCSAKFAQGAPVILTAAVDAGGGFQGWSGDCAGRGTNTTCPLTLSVDRSVTAAFTLKAHRLNVGVATPAGTIGQNGVARIGGPGLDCGPAGDGLCTVDVAHGTHVFLQANVEAGNKFLSWSGGPCTGRTTALCDFTLTANTSMTALVRGVTSVQVLKAGNGAGTVAGPGISCGNDCAEAVYLNTLVALTPTPAVGSSFTGWTGDVCDGQPAGPCTFTAAGLTQSVTATFQLKKQHLQVTGEGFGYTQSNIPGIDCGSVPGHFDCDEDYDYGTTVALVPTPGTDSMFVSWTGCSRLNGSTCLVDMTANHTVHKKFAPARLLSLSASGNGHGRLLVPGKPPVPCTGCSASFLLPYSATVPTVVTAAPDVGSNFQWVSAPVSSCIGKSTPCSFPMSQNQTVVGSFALNRHSLVVTNRLNGSVVGNFGPPDPFGVICGSGENLCATTQNYGTLVNLQATANNGFKFISWTGTSPCAVGTRAFNASCSFTLLANTTVIPNYRAATEIELDKLGSGTVAVTGVLSPAVVSCGPICSDITFTAFDGKLVTLKATPSIGWSAVGYAGDCVSNSSVCAYVPVGSASAITAIFELQQFAVNVVSRLNGSVVGTTAAGTIVTCGSGGGDCTETLDFGTTVSLTATANAGFVFVNWTGDAMCAGKTTPTCAFSVPNRIVTVTPNYRPRTGVTLQKSGNGFGTLTATGTLSPATVSCSPTCSSTSFAALDGKVVALKAMPSVGSSFVGFTGDCTSNTSACSFLPTGANDSVTGTFVLQQFQLAVTNRGNGSVTSNPPGAIDCGASGADCGETVNYGAPVSVVADPNDGFVFVSWTGDAVCAAKTTPTCSFTMPLRNVTVTPNYRARTLVNVVSDGGSLDLVVSTPAGIKCPGDCSEAFFDGRLVTLTATAGLGKDFQGFSGVTCLPPPGNISTPNVCRFFPTGDSQNISASFVLETRTVNLSVTGNGQVTSGVFGCDEPSSPCAVNGSYGTQVVFVAAPAPGQRLLTWTGCTSTNASFCTVLLNQASGNKTVTAAFGPIPAALITVGDGGVRTFGPPTVTVTVGQVVEWDWKSPNHNVVSGDTTTGTPDNQFCSPDDTNCATTPLLTTNSVYTHTFAVPGTYNYFCRAHRTSGMVGTIIVNPPE